jgi:CelD/BcsL family acetyltransferase involved in cellulose biosynthesis
VKCDVFPFEQLPGELISRWACIQQSNEELSSPFFRPEFAQLTATARRDVYVAVIDGGDAFFPFQRDSFGFGHPVGGVMSDYHGVIAPAGYELDPVALVRACGLRTWDFDHVPWSQPLFRPHVAHRTRSLVLDIQDGTPIGSSSFRSACARKRRKLEREVGNIRIELISSDSELLSACLRWKSAQYRRHGHVDLFERPWARELIEGIARMRAPEFAGVLSVMWIGDRPIAAHFGIRSHGVLHYWFPSYDTRFSAYSPGMLLLVEMISGFSKSGVEIFDFGKGEERYKTELATREIPLIEGYVSGHRWITEIRTGQAYARQMLKRVPLLNSPQTRSMLRWVERKWKVR